MLGKRRDSTDNKRAGGGVGTALAAQSWGGEQGRGDRIHLKTNAAAFFLFFGHAFPVINFPHTAYYTKGKDFFKAYRSLCLTGAPGLFR